MGLEQLRMVDLNAGGFYSMTSSSEQLYEWREVSRWIKYEQTIDAETNIWSKPSIGALVYQSLIYLKTGLQHGNILFIIIII